MIDRQKLLEMRANAEEVRQDLERREIEDPNLDIPVMREAPQVIRKVHYENHETENGAFPHQARQMTDDDLAWMFAQERIDVRKEFEAEIAELRGKVDALLTVLGVDGSSSRTKSIVRKRRTNERDRS
jgi:hypothetical protein